MRILWRSSSRPHRLRNAAAKSMSRMMCEFFVLGILHATENIGTIIHWENHQARCKSTNSEDMPFPDLGVHDPEC
jgi:hypothetical protein